LLDDRIHYKPWKLVKRDMMMEGKTLEQAQNEWRRLVMDPAVKKIKARGEWCIAEFQGVISDKFEELGDEGVVEALTTCDTTEAATEAMVQLKKFLSEDAVEQWKDDEFEEDCPDVEGQVPEHFVKGSVTLSFADTPFIAGGAAVADIAALEELENDMVQGFMDMEEEAESMVNDDMMKQREEADGAADPALILRIRQAVCQAKVRLVSACEHAEIAFDQVHGHLTGCVFKGVPEDTSSCNGVCGTMTLTCSKSTF
jgi:hypothetical protein